MKKLIAIIMFLSFSANAYSQIPFVCNNNFHQVFGETGRSLSYNPDTDETVVSPNEAGFSINAFGYRVEDNFAYGLATDSNTLLRLGSDGTVSPIDAVTGLPNTNFPAGTIADDDLLYVYAGSLGTFNTVYAIDIDSVSVVGTITVIGPTFSTADIAFNVDDGRFYGVSNMSGDLPQGNLFAFSRETGVLEVIGPTGLNDVGFASMFSDGSGNIYGHDRNSGDLYLFNLSDGSASVIGQNIIIDPLGGVDGFFCIANPGPIAKVVPTLSEWGLIAMVALLGVVGFIAIRRRAAAGA